jgi:hypothetical protein
MCSGVEYWVVEEGKRGRRRRGCVGYVKELVASEEPSLGDPSFG